MKSQMRIFVTVMILMAMSAFTCTALAYEASDEGTEAKPAARTAQILYRGYCGGYSGGIGIGIVSGNDTFPGNETIPSNGEASSEFSYGYGCYGNYGCYGGYSGCYGYNSDFYYNGGSVNVYEEEIFGDLAYCGNASGPCGLWWNKRGWPGQWCANIRSCCRFDCYN